MGNARHKLNAAHFNGSLILAAIAGLVLQSWLAFIVVFVVLLVLSCYMGDIRLSQRR
jgi:hypothetical protein